MNRLTVIFAAGLASLAVAAAIGQGAGPVGRVLLALGLPGPAALLFDDPGWRGAALYRAGDYESASTAFRDAGQRFNLGNSEVQAERYAAALEAYDIARLAGDPRADTNFDLVAAFYAGLALDPDVPIAWFTEKDGVGAVVESFVAQGSARAAGEGDEGTNFGALLGLPELLSHANTLPVRKVFDDKFMVANRRWLETLSDVPGEFLEARIAHERKRRAKLGLTQPDPEDPR